MKKLHKLALIVLLPVAILACGISAPVATPQPEKNPTIQPFSELDNALPVEKMKKTYSTTVTAEKWLYVRSSASHYAEVVGYLMNGEYVVVYECRGTWGRVGTGRWVNTIYLAKGCE